jgi:hypothetical protein
MNKQKAIRIILIFLIIQNRFSSYCFSQSSPMQLFDEVSRTAQLYGNKDSLFSFCVRPNYSTPGLNSVVNDSFSKKAYLNLSKGRLGQAIILPVIFQQQYNTHHPYGWNDGSMIPAKGYENQLSFGLFWKKGIISLQARPELVYTYNSYFSTFPANHIENIWNDYYYNVMNKIDAPDRFGYNKYLKIFPGQSSFKINYRRLSLGISTENLWWGPGEKNSLLMSNNAPGFPHIVFKSSQPVASPIGSFEWQLISGKLKASRIDPADTIGGRPLYEPRGNADRYLNGMVATWQPKWTKGLFLGFSRVFYQYTSDVNPSIDGYLPVIGKFLKVKLPSEDAKKRDQLVSLFFRLVLQKEKAELYGEFGRNDHSYNSRDLLLEPEHSRAYVIGFSKIFDGKKRDMQLYSEITNLQMTNTVSFRAQESWYTHYQIRHGYTNNGQIIGAGIGPGGSCQTFGLKWINGFDRIGGSIDRIVHNNDFYYRAFATFLGWQKHWVDYSFNLNRSWKKKNVIFDAQVSFINSLNYQWYYSSIKNLSAKLGACYVF